MYFFIFSFIFGFSIGISTKYIPYLKKRYNYIFWAKVAEKKYYKGMVKLNKFYNRVKDKTIEINPFNFHVSRVSK